MKTIEVSKKDLNTKEWVKTKAKEEHATLLIGEDTLITFKGRPIILYKKLEKDNNNLRWALSTIKYGETTRTNGLKTISSIFGFSPRVAIRNDYCNPTSMSREFKKQHFIITEFAKELCEYYQRYFPDIFEKHKKVVEKKVLPQWQIKGTPFTSGIVNKNNELKYHYDSGNFKNVASNMIVFKSGIEGGRLICPEYDIKFEVEDNTLMIFDGQSILHGVSPIIKQTPRAVRYSVVFYSLEQMKHCMLPQEEIKRIRQKKMEREEKRLKL